MKEDRSWMLNTKAIRTAKLCIQLVKDELGIKLSLSHPGFLELIEEYVELTGSPHLAQAFIKLAGQAGVSAEQLQMLSANTLSAAPLAEDIPLSTQKAG